MLGERARVINVPFNVRCWPVEKGETERGKPHLRRRHRHRDISGFVSRRCVLVPERSAWEENGCGFFSGKTFLLRRE